ncbi:UNVERIFIED_CONTAM: hypothetical protein ABID98_000950 [Brevibacillus sp. OAP136]
MASKTTNVIFTESTLRSQNKTISIDKLKAIRSVTVNTGTVTHTVSGSSVTVNVSNGTATRTETSSYSPTIIGTATRTTSAGGDPSLLQSSLTAAEAGYSGYTGTLTGGTATVVSGSYTPGTTEQTKPGSPQTKTSANKNDLIDKIWVVDGAYSGWLYGNGIVVASGSEAGTTTKTTTMSSSSVGGGCQNAAGLAYNGTNVPKTISYNDGTYSGTLTKGGYTQTSCNPNYSWDKDVGAWNAYATVSITYSGTVSKPDTRVYSQTYTGTLTKPGTPGVDTRVWQKSYSGTLSSTTPSYSTTYYYSYNVTITYEDNSGQTLTVTAPVNGATLAEGGLLSITGNTLDLDSGDNVTIKYRINDGTSKAITSDKTDGTTPITFSKQLSFENGRLYDGTSDVSGQLSETATHVLYVWSEDNNGGVSPVLNRTFTVTLNRAPVINVNQTTNQTGLIESGTLTFSGSAADPDGNSFSMTWKLNNGTPQNLPVSNGVWSFIVGVTNMQEGTNTILVTATDQYGAKSTKTITLNRTTTKTPLRVSHARYKVAPPNGTTREIIAWLQREKGDLVVSGDLSIVGSGQPENYLQMSKSSAAISAIIDEDQFIGTAVTAANDVVMRLTLTSTTATSSQSAVYLVGAIK